ncbi:MAG: M20/M25/M40 family metallo-hydrolase [Chloroflexota bacterium]|nr:M20/M25/M40 family metallo-hydrolase [Chloroflexota bacterium]
MSGVSSKVKLSRVFVPLATLVLLALAACFPGAPTATPEPAIVPVQPKVTAPAPTPSPAATPFPTPTQAPVVEPAPASQVEETQSASESAIITESLPAVSSPVFGDMALLEERAFSYLSELAVDVGVRTSGTELELAAADFLVSRLEDLGYNPEIQDFSWDSPAAEFSLVAPEAETLEVNVLGGTPGGQATGELVFVGLGKPADLPAEGLEGKIALIERGEITFGSKVAEVHNAGAVAAVIYNNVSGPFRGTLGGRGDIPAISLSQADGLRLKELLEQGETVEATVSVQDNALPSRNVIAELPGQGEGVIVVGAHYDTVPDSIGASDNSSGVGALLAIAERVADRSFPFTLRFIAFGSEETGLHGSEHYVDSLTARELEEIYLMVNLDSVGSGSHLRLAGDRWAASHIKETADREGISLELSGRSGRGGSDHANFRDAWVPVLFFMSDDLSRINSPADTMEHINSSLLGDVTALVLDLLENVDQLSGYGP